MPVGLLTHRGLGPGGHIGRETAADALTVLKALTAGNCAHRRDLVAVAERHRLSDERVGQHEPLSVTWEIEIVEGEDSKALTRRQTQAMLEVLAWIAEQRREEDSSTGSEQG